MNLIGGGARLCPQDQPQRDLLLRLVLELCLNY